MMLFGKKHFPILWRKGIEPRLQSKSGKGTGGPVGLVLGLIWAGRTAGGLLSTVFLGSSAVTWTGDSSQGCSWLLPCTDSWF